MTMKPEQIAKTSEHSHQAAFFCWANQHKAICAPLKFMFAIPNGGLRNKVQAGKLKAEGVKAGAPDVFFPFPSGGFHGLWIEFKKPGTENRANGALSKEQVEFRDYLTSQNYSHKVAYSYLQAIEQTIEYLSQV